MTDATSTKKRNPHSCDFCWKKKVKCNSSEVNGPCANCAAASVECLHTREAKKPGPKSKDPRNTGTPVTQAHPSTFWHAPTPMPTSHTDGSSPHSITSQDSESQDEDDLGHLEISERLKAVDFRPAEDRYFGPASAFHLVKSLVEFKTNYAGAINVHKLRRPQYWEMSSWEIADTIRSTPIYVFPPDDLMASLIDIYFIRMNLFYPLLHEPTFRNGLSSRLHYRNSQYGATVLLVCAVASRWSDDPRVLVDNTNNTLSSGWKYFEQVQTIRKDLFHAPTLYDLQMYCLSAEFLIGTSSPHALWHMLGLGLRFAEDIGAHRRKPRNRMTAEDELKKRAFWVLMVMDRIITSFHGRSCTMREEDYNADLPVECDDEYWVITDTGIDFHQPPNKPSIITAFNRQIALSDILYSALINLYSCNQAKLTKGKPTSEWEQEIVSDLDSRLNSWIDSNPEYLRWHPNVGTGSGIFHDQSAVLHELYYTVQMQIHRPFIHKQSPLSYSAVAICANAARSCASILEYQTKVVAPNTLLFAFVTGNMLMLNLWKAKLSGLPIADSREFTYVQKIKTFLKSHEARWHPAGRLGDVLNLLSAITDAPIPATTETSNPQAFTVPSEQGFADTYGIFTREGQIDPVPFGFFPAQPAQSDADIFSFLTQGFPGTDTEMMDVWGTTALPPVGFK